MFSRLWCRNAARHSGFWESLSPLQPPFCLDGLRTFALQFLVFWAQPLTVYKISDLQVSAFDGTDTHTHGRQGRDYKPAPAYFIQNRRAG